MNKHIVGFILFNLIVGTSIIIAAFFYQIPKYESVYVTPVTSETYTRSCWKGNKRYANKMTSAKVTQAVFDSKTQELKTELFVQSNKKIFKDIKVVLHFFMKDGDSTRYLGTDNLTDQEMTVKGSYDMSERRTTKATFLVNSSYDWLDDLKSRENLYVVPQIIPNAPLYEDYKPVFDELNATPVTLAH
jgi:hypothetical protein